MNNYLHEYETMPNHIHGKNENAGIPELPGKNENPVGADSISTPKYCENGSYCRKEYNSLRDR